MDLDEFKYANGDVDVFLRVGNAWVPWVLVRPSTIPGAGKGLFAAQPFPAGTCIGRFVGKILGRAADAADDARVHRMSQTVAGDAIVNVNGFFVDGRQPVQSNAAQEGRFGRVVFRQPDWSWPGVHAHLANDSRGTRLRPNTHLSTGGYLETTRRTPAYDSSLPHAHNSASEILWSYGHAYWDTIGNLGTMASPYVVE